LGAIFFFKKEEVQKVEIAQSDKILVKKSERKLYLFKDGEILREYNISLGKNPIGDKMIEGDKKTPEGDYIIDWRNPNSKFHLSLHISYPSPEDIQNGKTGSNIMIHGLPNNLNFLEKIYFQSRDWTDGCIAVKDREIEEIWASVKNGTPITIEP
jgi:murein L,D-transpeptidase YafK